MLKVLFINNVVYPVYDILLSELTKEKNLDLNFWVLSGEKKGSWDYKQKFKGNIKYLTSFGINFSLGGENLGIYFNPSIIFDLIKLSPDTIIISGWDQPSYLAAFIYAKIFSKKLILWSSSTKGEESMQRNLTLPYVRMITEGADKIVTLGRRSKEYLLSLGVQEKKIIVGGYACYVNKGQRTTDSIKSKNITFLYVGQLIRRKGLDLLIKAFKDLKSEDKELIICGKGPMRNELLSSVDNLGLENKVKFIDGKRRDELKEIYQSADVFVLPSLQEVWGLVVNEAMSYGLPVIVSDSAGCVPELVKEGKNGFTFKSGKTGDLKYKMEFFTKNKYKITPMGKESLEIIKKYTPSRLASGFLRAFEVK